MRTPRLLAAALWLCVAPPATPGLAASAPLAAPRAEPHTARQLLWQVRGPAATVYLLGSVHLLTPDAYPLDPVVDSAFAAARRVYFEIDLDSAQARAVELVTRGLLPAGRTLAEVVSPGTRALLDARLPAWGVSPEQVQRLRPWMLGLTLTQLAAARAGASPEHGLDLHLRRRARQAGKPVGHLESVDFQIGLLDGLAPAEQESFLRHALVDPDSAARALRAIRDAWRAGDAARLEALLNHGPRAAPALHDVLLAQRNRRWLPQIEAMLRGDEDVLVVVGAGHLVGPDGVVELLRARGHRVDPL